MRVVAQRVKSASVKVNNNLIASITNGLLLLVCVGKDDSSKDISYLVNKIANCRIFNDAQDKMNLNVQQVNGEILSVSQFTLYADIKHGNRPSFNKYLADVNKAKNYWKDFNQQLSQLVTVKEGIFGADMKVELINDGPVTIIFDSKEFL